MATERPRDLGPGHALLGPTWAELGGSEPGQSRGRIGFPGGPFQIWMRGVFGLSWCIRVYRA